MSPKPKLLCLPGSARRHSGNAAMLRAFAREAEGVADAEVYDGLINLPIFSPDSEGEATPGIVRDLKARVGAADGIVIACPEYVHSIPGGFKNLIDWLVSGDELPEKPVMLVHANGHGRGVFARAALLEVLRTVNVDIVEEDGAAIYLVSKGPGETDAILAEPQNCALLRAAAERFVSAIAHRRAARG